MGKTLEGLTPKSSACEICTTLGLRDEKYAEPSKGDRKDICYGAFIVSGGGINTCLQSDRALIRLMFLNLYKNTVNTE